MVLDFRMADTESQTSSNNASDCTSVELPPRPYRSQRIDYHLLNGGSDDEGDTESPITKKPRLDLASGRSESVGPGNSASQLNQELPTPSESIPDGSRTFAEGGPSYVPHAKARIKQHNHWLWNQFHVSSFQVNYGGPSEADGCLRIERYNAFTVAGKPRTRRGRQARTIKPYWVSSVTG
ncbi:hypothetical protein ASPFODRAFT_464781 [Aspergillus luchuensis CBS 106.47]|uniref:Uncharacterized protein n=1 Tax=Aspergillus luchuensis (strain CBS 106.47) TaxID=1137211 RepID=A0A1M3T061_ASPLC|nr:hypothetical protein ASPFODRAFT_464781 [Aspergillus luchuensis CBS 106.47]